MERLELRKHPHIKINEVRSFFGNTADKLINAIAGNLCRGKWKELVKTPGIVILGKCNDPWEVIFAANDKRFLITETHILPLFNRDIKR
jgi:hypothetical protein